MTKLVRTLACGLAGLALFSAPAARAQEPKASVDKAPPAPAGKSDDFTFDLLGAPAAPPLAVIDPVIQEKIILRRAMLNWHQGLGIGLVALTAGSIVTGQLNYNDKFAGDSTNKYKDIHTLLSGASLVTFAATGLLAAFAPVPMEKSGEGFDRITLHKYCMIGATAGMAAQLGLGLYTVSREGYVNQSSIASTHLVIGYVTLALMTIAVGAIVF